MPSILGRLHPRTPMSYFIEFSRRPGGWHRHFEESRGANLKSYGKSIKICWCRELPRTPAPILRTFDDSQVFGRFLLKNSVKFENMYFLNFAIFQLRFFIISLKFKGIRPVNPAQQPLNMCVDIILLIFPTPRAKNENFRR